MSRSRERLFKMLTAFSFDEVEDEKINLILFERIESVLKQLSGNEGIKKKTERKYLGTVHHETFTGADFLNALQKTLDIKETAETIHLANLLLHYGYIYAADGHNVPLVMKEDNTLYRFQNTKFWPSNKANGSEEEYAIYLQKKKLLAKGKDFQQHEKVYFNKLHELFGVRWRHVVQKAEHQCRILEEMKKIERVVLEREEESFWRTHRPSDECVDVFDVGQKKFLNRCSRKDLRTISLLQRQVDTLKERSTISRIPTSVAISNLTSHCEQFSKVDVILDSKSEVAASSCWLKDFVPRTLSLNLLRLMRWSISLRQLLSDKKGVEEFEIFLKKEYSDENLRFWLDCESLQFAPKSTIPSTVIRIYRDFMATGARYEINVDNKAMSMIRDGLRNPSVYAFDLAQTQIYNLMNTDSYPRFLKSQQYQDLMEKARADKSSKSRKSNNRLLNAARGLVNRPSLTDLFSNNQKEHRKLGRSSSDFQVVPAKVEGRSVSFNTTTWHLQPALLTDRSSSENDLTKIDNSTDSVSPGQFKGANRMKLKGLPILKLSRSITPSGSPIGSPSHSGPASRNESPLASPCTTRKKFDFRRDSDKMPTAFAINELNDKLSLVKKNQDEANGDIGDWKWHKVSHDFY